MHNCLFFFFGCLASQQSFRSERIGHCVSLGGDWCPSLSWIVKWPGTSTSSSLVLVMETQPKLPPKPGTVLRDRCKETGDLRDYESRWSHHAVSSSGANTSCSCGVTWAVFLASQSPLVLDYFGTYFSRLPVGSGN